VYDASGTALGAFSFLLFAGDLESEPPRTRTWNLGLRVSSEVFTGVRDRPPIRLDKPIFSFFVRLRSGAFVGCGVKRGVTNGVALTSPGRGGTPEFTPVSVN
jgi:hypothetical protein